MKFSKKDFFLFLSLVVLFFVVRLPAIHSPLHQDEYKWPIIVNPALTEPGGIPHPPVGEFIYREIGAIVGYDNFRIIPLVFSFFNLILIFYLAKLVGDKQNAFWTTLLFTISFYSVLASLMVDTDGAIMPTFLLITFIGYYKLREINFQFRIFDFQKSKWLGVMILGMIFGFFVKASFIIGIAALALDFAFERKVFENKKKIFKYLLYGVTGLLFLGGLLFVSKFIFPYFRLDWTLQYWSHFIKLGGRGWFQTMIQFVKAIMYLSPLLVLPILFIDKQIISKYRPFLIFILGGLFFYIIAFDFSEGALDRYFQFLILPLVFLMGSVFSKYFNTGLGKIKKKDIIFSILISIAIFSLQFFVHFVPPLHPKSEWIDRFLSLKWNFLFPFTGGSGPLAFYVSFVFIALLWISSFVFVLFASRRVEIRKKTLLIIFVLGLFYNGVFVEEYLFGKINGFAPKLVKDSSYFIKNNKDIKKVVVYNDNGGNEIRKTGKYEKRLYTSPNFDLNQKIETINNFSGHYLEINNPPIDPNSVYRKYFDSCSIIYEKKDKYIIAKIYDCRDIKVNYD